MRGKARVAKAERRAISTFRKATRGVPPDPQRAAQRARQAGVRMSSTQAEAFKLFHGEKAFAKVKGAQRSYEASESQLEREIRKADIAAGTVYVAPGGLAVGKAVVTGGKAAAKKVGGAASAASKRNLAAHASAKAAKRASRRIRPKARARAKARGTRYAKGRRARYGKEGRKVARRTRARRVGLLTPAATQTGAGVGGLGAAGVAVEAHVEAIKKKPATVLKRTIEIAPGLVVSTADLAAQVALALGTGNVKGLKKRLGEDAAFAKNLVATMASGDKGRIRRYVIKHGLIAPLLLAPGVVRTGSIAKRGTREHPTRPRETDLSDVGVVKRSRIRQRHRQRLSRDAARAQAEASADSHAAGIPVVRAYTGREGRKGVEGKRGLRDKDVDRGDVMALVVEEGLKPGSKVVENFEAAARKWGKRPVFVDKREGGVTGHDLIEYVRRDPGIWQDKAFWRQLQAYRRQEPGRRTSERVVDIEQAKTLGVQLAEERPTALARGLIPGVASRADVELYIGKGGKGSKRVGELRRRIDSREKDATKLRDKLRQLENRERVKVRRAVRLKRKPPPMLAMTKRRRSQLLDAEADVSGLRAELRLTEKRHKAIRSSLRAPAESALAKQEFDAELAAERGPRDLVRGGFVPHVDVGRTGIPVAQEVTRAGKKIHKRGVGGASLAERGRVDYNLGTVVQAGIEAPIVRDKLHGFIDTAVREGAIKFRDAKTGKVRRIGTREQLERGLTSEQKAQGALFPLSHFKQAIKDDDLPTLERIVDDLGKEVAAAEGKPRQKYVMLDRDYAAELKVQLSAPGSVLRIAQDLSRGVSRIILSTPAWAIAQVAAEGWQALHAIPASNPLHVGHWWQGYVKGQRGMSPAKRREFRAGAGSIPGMGAGPRAYATVTGRTHRGLADNFKKLERVLPLKRLIQAARLDWIKATDRIKGGEFRIMVAATKAHKYAVGLGVKLERLVKAQHKASERFAKMTPGEIIEWSIRDTPAKRRIFDYVDDVMGNWTAFSRREKVFAEAAIFYNFMRMSMQWPFYTFPKHHPVRATVMYELAASHNNQLRELLGPPPGWLSSFGKALIYGKQPGEVKVISATRMIPGAGTVLEAVSGGVDIAVQRGANPVISYFNALVNGIDPLSGEKVDEHMSGEESFLARMGLTISVLFNTAPPLRAIDQARGPMEATSLPIVGPRRKRNALGEVIEHFSGDPAERVKRTLANPFPAWSGEEARDAAALGRIFEIWRTSGSSAQDRTINDDTMDKPEKKRILKEMKGRSDEADRELHNLFRKYAKQGWQRKEDRESEEYSDLKHPADTGYAARLSGDSGSGSAYSRRLNGKSSTSDYAKKLGLGE